MGLIHWMILLCTLVTVAGLLLFPGPGSWIRTSLQHPRISALVLLLYAPTFLVKPRGLEDIVDNPVDGVRGARIVLICAAFCVASMVIAFKKAKPRQQHRLHIMLAFACIAMLSAAYSPYRMLTLWKAFEVFTVVLFVVALSRFVDGLNDLVVLLRIVVVPLVFLVISALWSALLAPGMAFKQIEGGGVLARTLTGLVPLLNPNTLTQLSALLFMFFLVQVMEVGSVKDRVVSLCFSGLMLLIALLGHSRTSLLGIAVGLPIIFVSYRKRWLTLFSVWVVSLILFSGAARTLIVAFTLRGQTHDKFMSLTGRMDFWPLVWTRVLESPIWGHGYYASQRMYWGTGSVDNTYLEVMLGMGVIGVAVLIWAVCRLGYTLWSATPLGLCTASEDERRDSRVLIVSGRVLFVSLVLRSLTGPSFQQHHVNLILFAVLQTLLGAYHVLCQEAGKGVVDQPGWKRLGGVAGRSFRPQVGGATVQSLQSPR